MIRQIYEVTYNERFGYANTYEEAKQMEENFKSPYIDEKILYVSFNQDSSCFSVGTEKGFRIYSTFPYKNISNRSK